MNVAEYTQNELEKALVLLELHLRKHPICISCIIKSLYTIEGFAEEGIKFLPNKTIELRELINWLQKYQPSQNSYNDILKQLLLLQIHLFDFIKLHTNEGNTKDILFCKDCLQKHLLLLESLTQGNLKYQTINQLVYELKSALDLDNLSIDIVNKYLDVINSAIDNLVLEELDLSKISKLVESERTKLIQDLDRFRRVFLPSGQCYKCQIYDYNSQEKHL